MAASVSLIPMAAPVLDGREIEYATDAIRSGRLSRGPYNERFEAMFAARMGQPALACSSGTAALHLALLALGIGRGDEVIVPDLTFAATAAVVKHVGATPVLVDVDETWCLDPTLAERAITPRTKALMPVHLYGVRPQMEPLADVARRRKLRMIEDCCEAIEAQPADIGCYSFYGNKHITTGEGGMLVGPRADMLVARLYRDGGRLGQEFYHVVAGLNYRLTNVQAAIGCAQLERMTELVMRREAVVRAYRNRLPGHGEWLFVLECEAPAILAKTLRGIETRRVFCPLHRQPPYRSHEGFPRADAAYAGGLCLPTGPHLDAETVERIIAEVECRLRDVSTILPA